jgi:hypothetical protein
VPNDDVGHPDAMPGDARSSAAKAWRFDNVLDVDGRRHVKSSRFPFYRCRAST